MTTPQGPGPSHSPADPPAWGQPPAGGWGAEKDAALDDDRTQRVDPRTWQQAGQPQQPQQPQQGADDQTQHYSGPPFGAPQGGAPQGGAPQGSAPQGSAPQGSAPQGGQPNGGPQHGAPQYGGQPYGAPQYGAPPQPPYGGQQYGPPQQPYGAPPQQYGAPPPYPGQQPPPYGGAPAPGQQGQQDGWGRPADQGWGPPPTQQWSGGPPTPQAPDAQSWTPQPDVAQGYPPLPDAAEQPRRSKLPLIIGLILVLAIAAGAVLAFLYPGFLVNKVFDTAAVQAGVQKILTENYQIQGVSGVTCGQNIAVTNGATFTCDATIDGQTVKVPVRITSSDGNYEVGRPA